MAELSLEDHVTILFTGSQFSDPTGAAAAQHILRVVGLVDQKEKLVRLVGNFKGVDAYAGHLAELRKLITEVETKVPVSVAARDGGLAGIEGMTPKEKVSMLFATHLGWINAKRMLISNTYPLPVGALLTEQKREINQIEQMLRPAHVGNPIANGYSGGGGGGGRRSKTRSSKKSKKSKGKRAKKH